MYPRCHEYAKLLIEKVGRVKEGFEQYKKNCLEYGAGASCHNAANLLLRGEALPDGTVPVCKCQTHFNTRCCLCVMFVCFLCLFTCLFTVALDCLIAILTVETVLFKCIPGRGQNTKINLHFYTPRNMIFLFIEDLYHKGT